MRRAPVPAGVRNAYLFEKVDDHGHEHIRCYRNGERDWKSDRAHCLPSIEKESRRDGADVQAI
jgi:hypothetical protein